MTRQGADRKAQNIRSYRELRVWQAAMDAAMKVFELTREFPPQERYSMTDQMRRSSRSVPTNIAEAWRKGRYPASFVHKLSDSDAEAAETQTWLELAVRCGYLDRAIADALNADYEGICGQLVRMLTRPQDWTIRSGRGDDDR